MKIATQTMLTLILVAAIHNNAFSENTNPYANMPPGAMPGGFDMQKMMQAQQARDEKKNEKKANRAAISKAIADEELAKAKAETKSGSLSDPYTVAEVRTRKRMEPIYAKWKQEDAAERAPMEQKAQQNYQHLQQTGDYAEFGRQQQEMLKHMGIEIPPSK